MRSRRYRKRGGTFFEDVQNAANSLTEKAKETISGVTSTATELANTPPTKTIDAAQASINSGFKGLENTVDSATSTVSSGFQGISEGVQDSLKKAKDSIIPPAQPSSGGKRRRTKRRRAKRRTRR